ncbi:MAG: RelA/SpoT family protein [Candidatus Paceibacterota bacterium]|nr:MAG: RelA/SpoT family protein [Candidatus Paceibacterota bacterium]
MTLPESGASFLETLHRARRFGDEERERIVHAFAIAQRAHAMQTRKSGEPYLSHPIAIAQHLATLGMDAATIAAALLHDVLEDTATDQAEIARACGNDVLFLVQGVTKLSHLPFAPRTTAEAHDAYVASFKNLVFAMAEDLRVIIIKLADRRHNLMTLDALPEEDRQRIARETIEIYAPIASRLGMGTMRGELEDLAFPYAYPEAHAHLSSLVHETYDDRLAYTKRITPIVARTLDLAGVRVRDIHARAKHTWSLYQKMQRDGLTTLDTIFDLVALRVIVDSIPACYEALGAIHARYKPLPGRIKDYIALPKPNGYRSLHTTVFCEEGRVTEIQIRTPDMHAHAEHGIAAHWAYSESGKVRGFTADTNHAAWVASLRDTLKDIKTSSGMARATSDFLKNRMYVFTPQGDVKDLPEGSTPVDFAYAVHTNLGHAIVGAKINGAIAPLSASLHNGDVVEVLKSKTQKPSFDWLAFVRTSHARQSIQSWFKNNDPRTMIANGKALLAKELRRIGIAWDSIPRATIVQMIHTYSARTTDGLLSRISVGDVSASEVVKKFFPEARTPRKQQKRKKSTKAPQRTQALIVAHDPTLPWRIGKCCAPEQPERIIGYITRGKGITVHARTCTNAQTAPKERLVSAKWNAD